MVRREGDAVTIVAWQDMLRRALRRSDSVQKGSSGNRDPGTLNPFDRDTIIESVKKTGACMVGRRIERLGWR